MRRGFGWLKNLYSTIGDNIFPNCLNFCPNIVPQEIVFTPGFRALGLKILCSLKG